MENGHQKTYGPMANSFLLLEKREASKRNLYQCYMKQGYMRILNDHMELGTHVSPIPSSLSESLIHVPTSLFQNPDILYEPSSVLCIWK